ncbi:MAG: hypothetical protein M3O65_14040 [Actinomycetota bacterium]|nr:hypothetical protein [Actinomycetota bacterium]
MQPAQGAGAFGDQVITAIRQQPQDHRLVLGDDRAQLPVVEGGGGDRAGISQVGLAGAAGGKQPGPGGQLGWYVNHRLAGGDQKLGDAAAQATGSLDRPAPLRPGRRPGQQLLARLGAGRQPQLGQELAVGIQGGGGQRALVRVDPDGDHRWPFVAADRDDPATGSLTSGGHTPLLSHVTAGAGRSRHAINEPTQQGGKVPPSQTAGTLDATGCRTLASWAGFNKSGSSHGFEHQFDYGP